MSKKLDSILGSVPPATSKKPVGDFAKNYSNIEEEQDRLVAVVPKNIKRQLRQYIVDNPGETEKTVILRALKTFGFDIPDNILKDKRGNNR